MIPVMGTCSSHFQQWSSSARISQYQSGSGLGVMVGLGVTVAVGVNVAVGLGVRVGVYVAVGVGVRVGVTVGVSVDAAKGTKTLDGS